MMLDNLPYDGPVLKAEYYGGYFYLFLKPDGKREELPSSEWAKRYMDFVDKNEAGDSGSEERGDS